MCVSEAVPTFSTSSHYSFFFPENKGVDVAFHKLTDVLATDAAQEMCLKKKNEERRSLGLVWFHF